LVVPPTIGNLLVSGGVNGGFGADGGYVMDVVLDGRTYSYDIATDTVTGTGGTDRSTFDSVENVLSVKTVLGGTFNIDLDTGAYTYTPSINITKTETETIGYALSDRDGDTGGGILTITVNPPAGVNRTLSLSTDGGEVIGGGEGNNSLLGTTGSDTFQWTLADKGSAGAPANDVVTGFDTAAANAGGDVLDLRDLLQGENAAGGVGNLGHYLHFEKAGADTVVHISSAGGYAGGFTATADDQRITLSGVDLTTSGSSDQAIIQDLLTKGKLIVDL
jgi:large repetitive protein